MTIGPAGPPPIEPITASEAGAGRRAGWLSPEGKFYPCGQYMHVQLAARLRAAGTGPTEPWNMRDGWAMIRVTGEITALPHRLGQAQLDFLMDALVAAPFDSLYRGWLLASLRMLRELEMCR